MRCSVFVLFSFLGGTPALADIGVQMQGGLRQSEWKGDSASTAMPFAGRGFGGAMLASKAMGALQIFADAGADSISESNESDIAGAIVGTASTRCDAMLLGAGAGLGLRLGVLELQGYGGWKMSLSPKIVVKFTPTTAEGTAFEGSAKDVSLSRVHYGMRLRFPADWRASLFGFVQKESGNLSYRISDGKVSFATQAMAFGGGISFLLSGAAPSGGRP